MPKATAAMGNRICVDASRPADTACPGLERLRGPVVKRRDKAALFLGVSIPPPRQPKKDRNANEDQEEQGDYRECEPLVGATAEKDP